MEHIDDYVPCHIDDQPTDRPPDDVKIETKQADEILGNSNTVQTLWRFCVTMTTWLNLKVIEL